MTNEPATHLFAIIDRIYVINLVSRPDRRREMQAELARIGLAKDSFVVDFFAAVKPASAGTFPSIGARGCFLSHLGVLLQARKAGHRAILILEDDATFTPAFLSHIGPLTRDLGATNFGLAYLGHRIAPGLMPKAGATGSAHWRRLPPETGIETTHAMLIPATSFDLLITYLERMMARAPGHPDGGPMHVDGAYSWFRRDHPEVLTLVTPQPYVAQRASKSDIAPSTWKDKIPLMALVRQLKNRFG